MPRKEIRQPIPWRPGYLGRQRRVSNGTPGTTPVTARGLVGRQPRGHEVRRLAGRARLIEREISRPLLLTRYRRKVARPDRGHRDLGARRVAGTPPDAGSRRRISPRRRSRWIASMVRAGRMPCEARGNAWIRGGNIGAAGRVPVTLLPSKRHARERQVEMDVSPHLKIRMPLAEIAARAVWRARGNLDAVYEFVARQSGP